MSTAIVTLLSIGIMLTGMLMLFDGSFSSMVAISDSMKQMEARMGEVARTRLTTVSATSTDGRRKVRLVLRNDGQVALSDFDRWDVVIQYTDDNDDYRIDWLPFSSAGSPGNNEWIVDGIFLDEQASTPEVFEPGVLNPGEEIAVLAQLQPKMKNNSSNLAIVSTPNGVAVSVNFSG